MSEGRKIRVVVAKPGLDGHDASGGGAAIRGGRRPDGHDGGETARRGDGGDLHGPHQTPEQIAATVIQEDADAVGLSILSALT